MKWNFLYQITAASRTPWLGGYRPQIPVLSILCLYLNLLTPPPKKNSWVRHCVKLTIHVHLLSRLRKSSAIPPLQHTPSWCVHGQLQFHHTIITLLVPATRVVLNSIFFSHGSTGLVGQGLLIVEVPRSHSDTPYSVRLLWTSDQDDAETSTWQHNTHKRQTSMLPAGFEPAISASEQPHTHA